MNQEVVKKNEIKFDKKKLLFITVVFGFLLPLSNLWLSIIFSSDLVDINFSQYLKPLTIGFVIYSLYYILFPLYMIKKGVSNLDSEKRISQEIFFRILPVTYFSTLGFFLVLITSNIIYSIVGTSISLILAVLIVTRENRYFEFQPHISHRLPGITFFGWMYIVFGLLYLYSFLMTLSHSSLDENLLLLLRTSLIGWIFMMVLIGLGILYLIDAVRIMVIIFNSIHILAGLIGVFTGSYGSSVSGAWGVPYFAIRFVIAIVIVFYFTEQGVKNNFKSS